MVTVMTMSSTLPVAEVKAHLSELVSRVNGQHERVTVTVHGRPSAVLMATEDLQSLEETIAVLSDPETMRQMAESDAEIERGTGESEEQLTETMRRASRVGLTRTIANPSARCIDDAPQQATSAASGRSS